MPRRLFPFCIGMHMATDNEHGWSLETEAYRAEFLDIGEGVKGDFDPADPDDEPMLCIDVFKRDSDGQLQLVDAAFCRTSIPVNATADIRQTALETVMGQVLHSGMPQSAVVSAALVAPAPVKAPGMGM